MKFSLLLIVSLLVVIGARALPPGQRADDQAHQQWLEARYKEATSIQPGMTRADLLKLFIQDGGVQTIPAERYVLKSSYLIQINVKFNAKYRVNGKYTPVPDNELKIIDVSRPYLGRPAVD